MKHRIEGSERLQPALSLLREMSSQRLRMDTVSYNMCISISERLGLWQLALSLLEELET